MKVIFRTRRREHVTHIYNLLCVFNLFILTLYYGYGVRQKINTHNIYVIIFVYAQTCTYRYTLKHTQRHICTHTYTRTPRYVHTATTTAISGSEYLFSDRPYSRLQLQCYKDIINELFCVW